MKKDPRGSFFFGVACRARSYACSAQDSVRTSANKFPRYVRGRTKKLARCTGRERRITALAMGSATLQGLFPSWKKKPWRRGNEFLSEVFLRLITGAARPGSVRAGANTGCGVGILGPGWPRM